MNHNELKTNYPEHFKMLEDICCGRRCSECRMHTQCSDNYDLDFIEEYYNYLFPPEKEIDEDEIMSLLGD